MFCERCGFKLVEGQRFCSSCGKPVGISLVPLDRQGKVQRNLQVLAILWLVAGALNLVIGFGLFTVGHIVFGNMIANTSFHPDGLVTFAPIVRTFMSFIGGFIILKSLFALAAGLGLLQRQTWARPLAIVMSFFELLHVPFGTALGIYTLVVLLPAEASVEYDQLAKAA
jgi:hypothetical protein